jgi:hypothetical protein
LAGVKPKARTQRRSIFNPPDDAPINSLAKLDPKEVLSLDDFDTQKKRDPQAFFHDICLSVNQFLACIERERIVGLNN